MGVRSVIFLCQFEDVSVCANDLKEIKTKLKQLNGTYERNNRIYVFTVWLCIKKVLQRINSKEIQTIKKKNSILREDINYLLGINYTFFF